MIIYIFQIMSDDEIPDLEDLSNDLEKIRQIKGINHPSSEKETEIKVNVIESNNNKSNQTQQSFITSTSQSQSQSQPKPQQNKEATIHKNDEDFGKGFGRGFFKKQKQPQSTQPKQNQQFNQSKVEDLTHIKSTPGTTNKTSTVETFTKDLKESLPQKNLNSLSNNIIGKKDEWVNQELLMKISQNPNLMKYFIDPRFTSIIQEMQKNPKECMEKYGSNPEFSTFIREFSQIMGSHFTNLSGQKNATSENNNFNDPEVQKVLNDPKVIPFLAKLQQEGKVDIEELNKDPYLAQKINLLVDKKLLNIQKMD